MFLAIPLVSYVFKLSLNISGLDGLTDSNFFVLIRNPFGLTLFLFSIVILVLSILLEFVLFIYIINNHYKSKNFSLKEFLKFFKLKGKKLLAFQFFIFFFYFIIIIPVGSLNFSSTITRDIFLPKFISGELLKSTSGTIIYFLLLGIIAIINLKMIFTLFIFIEKKEYGILDSLKESFKITNTKYLIRMLSILVTFVVLFLVGIMILQFLIMLPVLIADHYNSNSAPYIAGITLTFISVSFFIIIGLGKIFLVNILKYFYKLKTYPNEIQSVFSNKKAFHFRKLTIAIALTYFIIGTILNINFMKNVVYKSNSLIIAHRGNIQEAVENSLESLSSAATYSPDYVELDVQETKDKKFVVFHDLTLRRLNGSRKRISDMTLSELKEVPISSNGFTSTIPSFEEFIVKAKELDQKLLIEIKLHGNESPDMMDNFVKLLKKYNVEETFRVQSLDKDFIEKFKEKYPSITTGYVVALNIGYLVIVNSDFIVIEDFSLSQKLFMQGKSRGQDIFVWTINDRTTMKKYMSQNINGIITNEVALAKEVRNELSNINSFSSILKITINNLANNR